MGYIAGAFLTFALVGRVPENRLFSAGLIVTSVSLLMCGFSGDIWHLTFWRILAGIAGAPAFIAGSAMVAALFPNDPQKNALAIAGYFSGAGLGMILSGAFLPALFASHGPSFWPYAWIGIGLCSLLMAPISLWAAGQIDLAPAANLGKRPLPARKMTRALIGYGLFATGYIVYLTFIIAWAKSIDLSVAAMSAGWVLIGLGIIISPFVWRPVLARHASGLPLALTCAATGLATLAPVLFPGIAGFAVSSFLFGLAVFMGPGSVTNFGRKNLPRQMWAKSVSLFTVIFAIGQTIGPVAAGAIADMTGDLSTGLLAAGAILLLAAGFAFGQKPISEAAPRT